MLKCCNGKGVALRRLVSIRFGAVFVIVILSGFFAFVTAYHFDGSASGLQALYNK